VSRFFLLAFFFLQVGPVFSGSFSSKTTVQKFVSPEIKPCRINRVSFSVETLIKDDHELFRRVLWNTIDRNATREITSLNLQGYDLDPTSFKDFLGFKQTICNFKNLKELDLSNSFLGRYTDKNLKEIFSTLRELKNLEEINLSGNRLLSKTPNELYVLLDLLVEDRDYLDIYLENSACNPAQNCSSSSKFEELEGHKKFKIIFDKPLYPSKLLFRYKKEEN
jgi:hypothetical protein